MSDNFRTTPSDPQWSGASSAGNGQQPSSFVPPPGHGHDQDEAGEAGKALVVGLLGGLLSAAGYMIYRRLPDDQKERIHTQVRTLVQQRISEIRQNFNI